MIKMILMIIVVIVKTIKMILTNVLKCRFQYHYWSNYIFIASFNLVIFLHFTLILPTPFSFPRWLYQNLEIKKENDNFLSVIDLKSRKYREMYSVFLIVIFNIKEKYYLWNRVIGFHIWRASNAFPWTYVCVCLCKFSVYVFVHVCKTISFFPALDTNW